MNRVFDDAFKKVDGTGCVTAAGPEEPNKVFTQTLSTDAGHPRHPQWQLRHNRSHRNKHKKRSSLHATKEPVSSLPGADNPGSQIATVNQQGGDQPGPADARPSRPLLPQPRRWPATLAGREASNQPQPWIAGHGSGSAPIQRRGAASSTGCRGRQVGAPGGRCYPEPGHPAGWSNR